MIHSVEWNVRLLGYDCEVVRMTDPADDYCRYRWRFRGDAPDVYLSCPPDMSRRYRMTITIEELP